MALLKKSFDTVHMPVKTEDHDLAAIRKYALREMTADEVWTGSMRLAHDRYDRAHERFPKAYLERFAETLPGKSVLGGHAYDTLPLGRLYSAAVVPDSEGHHLKVGYYLLKDSPLIPQIELGILRDVSIGFNAGKRVCDLCQKTWDFSHEHYPGQEYDGKRCTLTYDEADAGQAEGMEASFVWAGCQPGAEAVAMAAKGGPGVWDVEQVQNWMRLWQMGVLPDAARGANGMELQQAMAEIERLKALPLAETEREQLTKQIAELKAKEPLADDGAAYRQFLKAEMKRMANALDERRQSKAKGEFVDALLSQMENASAETLTKFLAPIKEEFDAAFAQGSAHGNGPGDDQAEKKKTSPFGRLAMGGLR